MAIRQLNPLRTPCAAAAVSAAVMVPVGAQADVTVYGRINTGIELVDPAVSAADSTADVSGFGSRLGFRASSDLGNGLTARGHYEFGIGSDKRAGINQTRHAKVGLAGGFGAIDIGQQGAALYGNVHFDRSIWTGGVSDPGSRTSNTIKYSNSVGPLSLEADLRLNGEHDEGDTEGFGKGDGFALGFQVAATDSLVFGLGFDSQDESDRMDKQDDGSSKPGPETDWFGASAMLTMGQFNGSIAVGSKEVTQSNTTTETDIVQLWLGASLGDRTSAVFGYGEAETGDNEEDKLVFGVSHNLGGGLRAWYEGNSVDKNDPTQDAKVQHLFGLRYDF